MGGETLVKAPKSPGIRFPSLPAWSLWQTLCALQVQQPLFLPPFGRDLLLPGRLDRL